MAMGSLFLSIWVTFTFTDKYLPLLLFFLFALLGGMSLGALNSRKARQQAKYKNEYTAYAGMFFAAIVFLGVYYMFFALYKIEAKIMPGIDLDGTQVVLIAAGSAIMGQLGIGLTVANSLAD